MLLLSMVLRPSGCCFEVGVGEEVCECLLQVVVVI